MDWTSVFHAEVDGPRPLTESELRQAFRLGVLSAFVDREVCSGYQNCCVCSECQDRARQVAERGFTPAGQITPPAAPAQPWDAAA